MYILLLITIGVLSRIVQHPANITAVGAVSLFSGMHIKGKYAFVVPVATMFMSDLLIGFHSVMWATYGSLFLAVVLGMGVRKRQSLSWILGASISSSLLFFLITNSAVWLEGSLYHKTFSGFIECFIMALPFFRNSLIGDIGYTVIFSFVCRFFPTLRTSPKKVYV